jgi:hypothetical protein
MPSTDIYARCNFTRSGRPSIRFNVLIKLPKAKLEELRQLPANRDQTDNQLLGSLAGKVITILYPEPGATFAVGCERYPEGAIPPEIKERPETRMNRGEGFLRIYKRDHFVESCLQKPRLGVSYSRSSVACAVGTWPIKQEPGELFDVGGLLSAGKHLSSAGTDGVGTDPFP